MRIVLCFFGISLLLKNLKETRATLFFKSTISRTYDSTRGFMTPDRFSLPLAVCTSLVRCDHYGALADIKNRCQCICPMARPTIGLFNGTWACTSDTTIRQNEGCKIMFKGETIHHQIATLNNSKPLAIKGMCKINVQKSKNIACDGKQHSLVDFDADRIHIINARQGTKVQQKPTVLITQAFALAQPHYRIDGKLIRLELNCTNSKTSDCLLFKVRGKTDCTIGKNNVAVLSQISKPPPSSKPTSATKSTRTGSLTPTTMTLRTTTATSSTKNSFKLYTSQINAKRNSGESDDRNVMPVGIGVAVVCVVLIIVTAAMVFHCYKRRRDLAATSVLSVELTSSMDPSSSYGEENAYAEIGETPHHKTMAFEQDGGYASLRNNTDLKQDHCKEKRSVSEHHEYESLKAVKGQNQTLYSTRETPEYKVLEGPDPNNSSTKK